MNKEKKYQAGYAQGYEDAVKTEVMYKEKEKQELLLGIVPVANKGRELIPHKDYEIKQDGEKFYLVKKKKEYPKTYTECSDILSVYTDPDIDGYKGELLWTFQKLLICRDAYWKIAGDEMGLGKPWEPDYTEKTVKYCLRTNYCRIVQTRTSHDNHPFSFPTAEMRDDFKKNFGPDLDKCKELI